MPFHHPVRLAVQLALLDNLSRGRIDVGVGKGTIYNEYEFVGHGLRSEDSRERMEESIDIIGRLWGGGPVTYRFGMPASPPRQSGASRRGSGRGSCRPSRSGTTGAARRHRATRRPGHALAATTHKESRW